MRSPARPNPIGITNSRLLSCNGLTLELARLDLLDGTPIIDIKPYTPGWDQVLNAHHARRTSPWFLPEADRQAMLRREADDAVGPLAPDALVTAMVEALSALARSKRDPRNARQRYTVPALDARIEMLTVMTGATFGNGRLAYEPSAGEPFDVG